MKTVLFVPGFKENINSRDYKSVIKAIESKGFKVKFVQINWLRTTINDWVVELDKEYVKHDPADTILAGFSYGSMTAFMLAIKKNPAELWLFSLSPYFAEDMPRMKKTWLREIGHRRTDVFRQLNFSELAKAIKCKTLIFVGEYEAKKYPVLGDRAKSANQLIPQSRLMVVPKAGHDVGNENYIKAIKDAI